MSIFVETSFTEGVTDTTDTSSNLASATSTPPTTVADSSSLHSESPKHDDAVHIEETVTVEATELTPLSRPRRARVSAPVYNLVQLSGTAGHGKRRAKGDIVAPRRRTISGATFRDDFEVAAGDDEIQVKKPTRHGIDALDLQRSLRNIASPRTRSQAQDSPRSQRLSSRLGVTPVSAINKKFSTMGKRNRKPTEKAKVPMSRELRRLQDTKEFAHIDDKPVLHTVWSNGKFVDPKAPKAAPEKAKPEANQDEPEQAEVEPITTTKKRRVKKYLSKGLYAGQDTPLDMSKGLSIAEKKKLAQLPELIPSGRVNKTMPSPMFNGLRTLIAGRDFKLPYHICNPLPPGQPKPDEWKKMTKSESKTVI